MKLTYTKCQQEIFFENELIKYKFIPKGRRVGFTRGASQACIEWMLEGVTPILWGDVIYGNLQRYIERYWIPILKENRIGYTWNKQTNQIVIGNSLCDFRSADNPDTWEGFGYMKVLLNEAGIILKNRDLYEKTVLPMLIDFEGTQIIAGGTPKGKYMKEEIALYYELCNKAKTAENYWTKTYTSYDNPFLSGKDLNELVLNNPSSWLQQEIYGQFIGNMESINKREWLKYYDELPECSIYMGVDLAISQKQSADYTAICVLGRASNGNIYLIDIIRERLPFNSILELIKSVANKYNPKQIGIENVQFQASVVQELLRTTTLNVRGVKPDGDKLTRYQPVAARYEQGLVYHSRSLIKEFEFEWLSFPQSQHDDMIDALSLSYHISKNNEGNLRLL